MIDVEKCGRLTSAEYKMCKSVSLEMCSTLPSVQRSSLSADVICQLILASANQCNVGRTFKNSGCVLCEIREISWTPKIGSIFDILISEILPREFFPLACVSNCEFSSLVNFEIFKRRHSYWSPIWLKSERCQSLSFNFDKQNTSSS